MPPIHPGLGPGAAVRDGAGGSLGSRGTLASIVVTVRGGIHIYPHHLSIEEAVPTVSAGQGAV